MVELVKKNLCANFIFNQSKVRVTEKSPVSNFSLQSVYDQAFEIDANWKSKSISLASLSPIQEPILITDGEQNSSCEDYSTNIHRYLDQLYRRLIETIA